MIAWGPLRRITFHASLLEKPFTRRGVLSTINSVYNPLRLASPVTLEGKLLLMGKKANNNMPWDCESLLVSLERCSSPPGKCVHSDRLETCLPFTNVGLYVFGPWKITTRRLKVGAANTKCWGHMFTCLSSCTIHIEVLETMDDSYVICALSSLVWWQK